MKFNYKYEVTKPFSTGYTILLGIGVLLTIGRWLSVFVPDFVIISAEIHSHISNLSLSLIAYLGIGYSWLLTGNKFRSVALLGLAMIAANFVCETLIQFMNTPDIIDAFYGTIGVAIAFTFLVFTNKYGLVPTNTERL